MFIIANAVAQELNEIKLNKSLAAAKQALKLTAGEVRINCFNGLTIHGSKYNPYTLSMIDGKCYLSFRDGQGVPHRLELDVKLYAVFDRFELDDLSFLNEQERHLDWTE